MRVGKLGVALFALCPLAALPQEPGSVEEYAEILREIRGLRVYNALRERQISAQEQDLANLGLAIEQVPDLQVQLPPLLISMVEGLEEFVERDVPFLNEERADRVTGLYAMIEETDLSDAVKLRRILESWMIEVEYGGRFYTYREEPAFLPPGIPAEVAGREVDFIHVGRIGLLFQTTDEDPIAGAWDSRNNAWIVLGSEHRNPVRQALRTARNQIAPELLLLPTLPPQSE